MRQGPDGAPQGLWQLYSGFQPIGPPAAAIPIRVLRSCGPGKNRLSRAQLRQDAAASEEIGGFGAASGWNTLSPSRNWSVGAADVVTVAFITVTPDGGSRCVAVGGSIARRIGYVQAVQGGGSRPAIPRVQAKLHVVGEGEGPGERRGLEKQEAVPKEFDGLGGDPGSTIRLFFADSIDQQAACGM